MCACIDLLSWRISMCQLLPHPLSLPVQTWPTPSKSATLTNPSMCLHYLLETRPTGCPISTNTSPDSQTLVCRDHAPVGVCGGNRVCVTTCLVVVVAAAMCSDQQFVTRPVWVPDSSCKECMICAVKFTAFVRKHHCRQCGRVICSPCSPYRVASESLVGVVSGDSKKVDMERICTDCYRDRSTVLARRQSGFCISL